MTNTIQPYLTFFQNKYNHDVSVYDEAFLQNIINDRKRELALLDDKEYLNYMEKHTTEATLFKSRLTNSYSEFFRNPLTFAYLEQVILPQLIEKKKIKKEKKIRIWSAACASGQEAYSTAILCDELIESKNVDIDYLIFATDLDPEVIEQAQIGQYQPATLSKVSLKRIQSYFIQEGENYSITPGIKNYVDFSAFDLLSGEGICPPASVYGNFDLIFCSNLLFYYKPEYRIRMLEKIGKSLSSGGYLITGETEREIIKWNNYRELFANSAIFQKK